MDFREGVPEEVTHELRKLKDMDAIQMEMGRGVVGAGLVQRKNREAQCLRISWPYRGAQDSSLWLECSLKAEKIKENPLRLGHQGLGCT